MVTQSICCFLDREGSHGPRDPQEGSWRSADEYTLNCFLKIMRTEKKNILVFKTSGLI